MILKKVRGFSVPRQEREISTRLCVFLYSSFGELKGISPCHFFLFLIDQMCVYDISLETIVRRKKVADNFKRGYPNRLFLRRRGKKSIQSLLFPLSLCSPVFCLVSCVSGARHFVAAAEGWWRDYRNKRLPFHDLYSPSSQTK